MRTCLKLVLAAVLICIALPVAAQTATRGATVPLGYKLGSSSTGVALNAADESARTFVIGPTLISGQALQLAGFNKLAFDVDYTWANNGKVLVTCTVLSSADTSSPVGAGAIYVPTTGIVSSGVYELAWAGVVRTPSMTASKSYHFTLGLSGVGTVKCIASHDGAPNANDKIKVQVTAIAD